MTRRCHHRIEQKPDYPNDYICRKCQTIWTYRDGMPATEVMTFPLVVRRLILTKQAAEAVLSLEQMCCPECGLPLGAGLPCAQGCQGGKERESCQK